jgi:two-component system sensor histidine kinase HydH
MSASTTTTQVENARRIEELGRIIIAYSEVTEKLQQSHDQLTETVRALQSELGEKNRLLERKNRLAALGEMAAGLAHEIRNPLGGIQLYASMLAQDVAGRPHSVELVRKISGCVRRLDSLVGQVLQFSREIVAQLEPVQLRDIVEQAVDLAIATAQRASVRYSIDGPESLDAVVDPLLMGQALLNLLLNAAEAIEPHMEGRVTVRFGRPAPASDAKQFHLTVTDTGRGIPPEVLDRIFNPFFTTKDTGTGLGLAIVHRVVEAHDGLIIAGNEEHGGARFEIRV